MVPRNVLVPKACISMIPSNSRGRLQFHTLGKMDTLCFFCGVLMLKWLDKRITESAKHSPVIQPAVPRKSSVFTFKNLQHY